MSIRPDTPFTRRLYALIGLLVAICAVLILLTMLQGARIRSASVDVAKVSLAPGQRLLLQLSQPVGTITARQISVEPAAAFTAIGGGRAVAVQFTRPLRSGTHYTVRLHLSGKHTAQYNFTTAPATIYYAVHADDTTDIIYRKTLDGRKDTVIFSGGIVDDYMVVDSKLVVSSPERGIDYLSIQDIQTHALEQVPLPEAGTVTTLRAAPDGRSFGFIFTPLKPQGGQGRLMLYNFGSHTLTQPEGFDHRPLDAVAWQFAPDSTTLAAQTWSGLIVIVRPGTMPVPLGQYIGLEGFTNDGTGLLVDVLRTGVQIINLQTAETRTVPSAGKSSVVMGATPFHTTSGYLLRAAAPAGEAGKQYVYAYREGSARQLLGIDDTAGDLLFATISANDQYAETEVQAGTETRYDVRVTDTQTGAAVASFKGNKVRWPSVSP